MIYFKYLLPNYPHLLQANEQASVLRVVHPDFCYTAFIYLCICSCPCLLSTQEQGLCPIHLGACSALSVPAMFEVLQNCLANEFDSKKTHLPVLCKLRLENPAL